VVELTQITDEMVAGHRIDPDAVASFVSDTALSAIAREITGVRWNGWVFFGLKNHRGAA
jgi:hypothetical protein